jgi:hypothetical protein
VAIRGAAPLPDRPPRRDAPEGSKALAETEYDKFRVEQDRDLVSDFEREVKRLEGKSKPAKPRPAKRSRKGSA